MTARGDQTITWDVENRPVSVSGGASFVYDGDGRRVKRTENSETTVYVNCYYEKNVTTGDEYSYYYLGGQQVAMRLNDTPSCIHLDCLSGI